MLKSIFKNRNSTNNMIFFLSSANVINTVLTLLSGLLVVKWMLPEELGLFTSFNIIVGYLILSQLGISSGLSRELPYLLGKKKTQDAYAITKVAQFWLLLISSILALILCAIAIYYVLEKNYINAFGFFTIAIVTFQSIYVTQYLRILYRTNSDFNRIAFIQIIVAIISFISVVFVWKFKFYGLCVRSIITAIASFILFWYWRPIRVKPSWNKLRFKELLKIGLPMYGVANVYALWPTLQKTLILFLGGTKYLGLFAIAVMVENGAKAVSSSINNVLYTKMVISWGEKHSVTNLMSLVKKPVFTVVGVFIPLIVIAWFLIPYVVENFLSNYVEGIDAAKWMLIATISSVLLVYTNVYNVVNKQRDRLIAYICGIAMWAVIIMTLDTNYGFSLSFFPIAIFLGHLTIIFITIFNIQKYKKLY